MTLAPQKGVNTFLDGMLRLAKLRDRPEDFALNHSHYVKGHSKKT